MVTIINVKKYDYVYFCIHFNIDLRYFLKWEDFI